MQVKIDKEKCIGCGLCPSISPAIFVMKDDGKAEVIKKSLTETDVECAKEAAIQCPVEAISIA